MSTPEQRHAEWRVTRERQERFGGPALEQPEEVARALAEQLRTWGRPVPVVAVDNTPPPIEPLEDDGRIA